MINPYTIHNKKYQYSQQGWSKGLTKETDQRVANMSVSLKNSSTVKGIAATPEKEELRKQKISNSMKENKKCGGYRHGSGIGKHGYYKGYWCDSTYELVFIIYCLDHQIKFERCPYVYEYVYENKKHKYHPDFLMGDDSLVEIKGYMTDLVNIKIKSVNDRPIKILMKKDMQNMFDYVQNTYIYTNLTDLYDKVEESGLFQ